MIGMIFYAALTTALFYLGSRAEITSFLWSRYPPWFAGFMDCSACTAFWWGAGIHMTIGQRYDVAYLGLDDHDLKTSILVGLCSLVVTPIVAGLMQQGFERVGSAVEPPNNNPEP